ncbi:YncE family protein [Evansella tamaricis]|uniref:YncE family protein n=1 Tax=Evansella tamaricis TaxID=2069301 RepID=A0ABS6JK94_9BACI|nr:YncE family protein [Evansella tamaricis]MBU9713619.1 YncE family protein [Evansella tamaricis]
MKLRNLWMGTLLITFSFLFFAACSSDTSSTDNGAEEVTSAVQEEADNSISEEDNSKGELVPEVTAYYEVWIADQGTNEIHIIDGETHEVIETIDFQDVGDKPHMLVFDDAGEYAYVANMGSGTVSVIDAVNREVVVTLETGEGAHAAVPSPDGERVLVANTPGQSITEIVIDKENRDFRLAAI